LLPTEAGLEGVIRHKLNRTQSRRTAYEFLPSLASETQERNRRSQVSLGFRGRSIQTTLATTSFVGCDREPTGTNAGQTFSTSIHH
jgi:hypothetical protein